MEVLLYGEQASGAAWQCPKCGRAVADGGACPLDGAELEEREEGLDLAIHQTLVHGGSAWMVRDRHDLEPLEGIGALLRF